MLLPDLSVLTAGHDIEIIADTAHAGSAHCNLQESARTVKGNFVSGYPDRDNHLIDAVRYAPERVYGKCRSNA